MKKDQIINFLQENNHPNGDNLHLMTKQELIKILTCTKLTLQDQDKDQFQEQEDQDKCQAKDKIIEKLRKIVKGKE